MIDFAENLNKMITAGLGGETEAPKTEVAVGYRSVYLEASGPEVEFETNVVAPLKRLIVNLEPIQEGSGDPSPENIRPITGYDSVTVTHKGKNLLDLSAGTKGTLQPEGTKTFFIGNTGLLPRPDGSFNLSAGQYTFASYGFRFNTFSIYDSTGAIITISDRDKYTFTIHDSGSYVLYFSISPEDFTSWDDVRILLTRGESAGEYTPYQADTITISLGQTVYGGTLDVTAGKLTIDIIKRVYTGSEGWSKNNSYQDTYTTTRTPFKASSEYVRSNYYASMSSLYIDKSVTIGQNVNIHDSRFGTVKEFREYLGQLTENDKPLEIVAIANTPSIIDLTPQQIVALIGKNYISSDAGDVSVSYLYYEETEGY